MAQISDWLADAIETWGDLAASDISIRGLAAATDLTRHKSHMLIKHMRSLATEVPEEETPINQSKLLLSTDYYFDKDSDTYVTYLKSAPKPLVLSGSTHRALKRAYSNWDGQPATINQICRRYEMPRPWFVEYKALHGWTHDSEPFTAEEVLEKAPEDLVKDALQSRRQVLFQQFESAKWKETQKDAKRWNTFKQSILNPLLEKVGEGSKAYQVPSIDLGEAEDPFVLVMGLTDFHWGSYAWEGETGKPYDRAEAERRLKKATEDVFKRLPAAPDEIILPIGSDFFDVDGDTAATSKGTPQDVDGTPSEILITGCELAQMYVDLLRQVAPVRCVLMSGNHDRHNGVALLLYLSAWYRGEVDVEVVLEYTPRVYIEYGENLLAFSHGDGGRTKPKDLSPLIATEARRVWGRTEFHLAFGGHFHHQKVEEYGGMIHYMMPSLCGRDRWHSRNGYTTANAALQAYLVDKAGGVGSIITAYVRK